MTSPYTRKEGETDTQTQSRENHIKTEAETELMHLQAKKHRGMPAAARSHQQLEEARKDSTQVFRRSSANTLISGFWPPELGENTFLLF